MTNTPQVYNQDNSQKREHFITEYLRSNIGRWVRMECFVDGAHISQIGQLIKILDNYALIKTTANPVTATVCDLNTVRFVTVLYDNNPTFLLENKT